MFVLSFKEWTEQYPCNCLIAGNFSDENIEEEKYPHKCGGSVYLDVFKNSVWPSYVTSSSCAFSGLGTHTLYTRSQTLNKIWIVWPRHMWWLKKLLPQSLLHFSKEFSLFLPLRISKVRKLVLAIISLQGQSGKMLIKLLDDPTCGSKDYNKAYFNFLGSSLPPKISEQILSHSEKRKQRKVSKNLSRLEWIIGSTKARNVRTPYRVMPRLKLVVILDEATSDTESKSWRFDSILSHSSG